MSESRLAAVIEAAAKDGSPVAARTPEARQEQANVALRRVRSFGRRRHGKATFESRVEDLAKGLSDHYEDDRRLVGPLIEDYRWLADLMLRALEDEGRRVNG